MAKKPSRFFLNLQKALEDARDFRLGKRTDLRVTEIPAPPRKITPREIRQIRRDLKASQTPFARYLNVSPNAVRSWERGTRGSQHAALKLLTIARKDPRRC